LNKSIKEKAQIGQQTNFAANGVRIAINMKKVEVIYTYNQIHHFKILVKECGRCCG
jgi:hypothetical protein